MHKKQKRIPHTKTFFLYTNITKEKCKVIFVLYCTEVSFFENFLASFPKISYNPVFDSVLRKKVPEPTVVEGFGTSVHFMNARYAIYFFV